MSYQWGPQGPAFEIHGVYRRENLALLVRAGLLGVSALIVLTLALSELSLPGWVPTKLLRLPQEGRARHVALGMLLIALAVIDVLRVLRQRGLRLLPGQPGALVTPLRTANTANPEARTLRALLAGEEVAPLAVIASPWPLLARLSPDRKSVV